MVAANTKVRILEAAELLIRQRGSNAVSFQQISEKVGLCKATVLHHYPSKQLLLKAVLERYSACFLTLFDEIVDAELDAPAKLRRGIALFQTNPCSERESTASLCGVLGAEFSALDNEAAQLYREFCSEIEVRLTRILKQGIDEGTFCFRGNSRAVAALVFSLLGGGVLIVRANGDQKQWQQISRQLLKLLGTTGT